METKETYCLACNVLLLCTASIDARRVGSSCIHVTAVYQLHYPVPYRLCLFCHLFSCPSGSVRLLLALRTHTDSQVRLVQKESSFAERT